MLVSQARTIAIVFINSVSDYSDVFLYSYFLILCLHEMSNPALIVFPNVPGELCEIMLISEIMFFSVYLSTIF